MNDAFVQAQGATADYQLAGEALKYSSVSRRISLRLEREAMRTAGGMSRLLHVSQRRYISQYSSGRPRFLKEAIATLCSFANECDNVVTNIQFETNSMCVVVSN